MQEHTVPSRLLVTLGSGVVPRACRVPWGAPLRHGGRSAYCHLVRVRGFPGGSTQYLHRTAQWLLPEYLPPSTYYPLSSTW